VSQVSIADCNILKYSLLWHCLRSGVLRVQVATRLTISGEKHMLTYRIIVNLVSNFQIIQCAVHI